MDSDDELTHVNSPFWLSPAFRAVCDPRELRIVPRHAMARARARAIIFAARDPTSYWSIVPADIRHMLAMIILKNSI